MRRGAWSGRLKTFSRRLRTRSLLRCLLVCSVGAIIRLHSTGLGPMGGIFLRHTSRFRHPCRDKLAAGSLPAFRKVPVARRPSPQRALRPYLVKPNPSKVKSDLTVSRCPPLGRRRLTSSFLHFGRLRVRVLPDIWDRTL